MRLKLFVFFYFERWAGNSSISLPPRNLICEQFVLRASIQVKRSDTSERVGITRVYTPYSLLCGYDPHTDAHQVII
jgi:hypothetical protein